MVYKQPLINIPRKNSSSKERNNLKYIYYMYRGRVININKKIYHFIW